MKLIQTVCIISIAVAACQPFQSVDPSDINGSLNGGKHLIVDAALQTQSLKILQTHCASCHDQVASGGISGILNVDHLIASGLIIPGESNRGRLITAIAIGKMPPAPGSVPVQDIITLRNWVNSMKYVD